MEKLRDKLESIACDGFCDGCGSNDDGVCTAGLTLADLRDILDETDGDDEAEGMAKAGRFDNIRPSYYNRGNIEVIDFIEDQRLDFCLGNAVKYICRAGFKDETTALQDLQKAVEYLNRKISVWAVDAARRREEGVKREL